MEFKGTKGKWEIGGNTEDGVLISSLHPKNRDVATVWMYGYEFLEKQESDSNSKLIASAPELLKACQKGFDLCDKLQFPTEDELKIMRDIFKNVLEKALT